MDLLQTVRKEGSRGGVDFKWDDVKSSNHRENYLGHSLMAPVGRWQRNKDLNWYAKADGAEKTPEEIESEEKQRRKDELRKVKEAEEDAMAKALGLPVPDRSANTEPLMQNRLEQNPRLRHVAFEIVIGASDDGQDLEIPESIDTETAAEEDHDQEVKGTETTKGEIVGVRKAWSAAGQGRDHPTRGLTEEAHLVDEIDQDPAKGVQREGEIEIDPRRVVVVGHVRGHHHLAETERDRDHQFDEDHHTVEGEIDQGQESVVDDLSTSDETLFKDYGVYYT